MMYNCYIGIFENSIFKKGKIYNFNNNFETLNFKNEENVDLKDKNKLIFEKKK